ncbi:MAG: phosphatase PAP2 family protein, partial [Actinomycetales bacterium]
MLRPRPRRTLRPPGVGVGGGRGSSPRCDRRRSRHAGAVNRTRLARGSRVTPRFVVLEVSLLAVLYVGYSASRLLASNDRAEALDRARALLGLEQTWHLDLERVLNGWLAQHDLLAVASSYWYATTHYLVTAAVLVWLFVRRPALYPRARTALVVASLAGLACYLAMPMAPPRFVEGYSDVLAL